MFELASLLKEATKYPENFSAVLSVMSLVEKREPGVSHSLPKKAIYTSKILHMLGHVLTCKLDFIPYCTSGSDDSAIFPSIALLE